MNTDATLIFLAHSSVHTRPGHTTIQWLSIFCTLATQHCGSCLPPPVCTAHAEAKVSHPRRVGPVLWARAIPWPDAQLSAVERWTLTALAPLSFAKFLPLVFK